MKKNFIIFICFSVSLLIISLFNLNPQKQVDEQVSNILEDKVIRYLENDLKEMINKPLHFNYFYLLFDEHHLNSQNIVSLFQFFDNHNYQYHIFEIYPYLNPLFKDTLNEVAKISFNSNNLKEISDNFYITYLNELQRHHLDGEIEKYLTGEIPIRMIKINTSNEALYNFLKQYKDIKYSLNSYGLFKKL